MNPYEPEYIQHTTKRDKKLFRVIKHLRKLRIRRRKNRKAEK